MKKNFLSRLQLIILVSLTILVSCHTRQSAVFSGQCNAPCWRQLQPGKTSMQDAMKLIQGFRDVDSKTIGTAGMPYFIFSDFIKFNLSSGESVKVYIFNDEVALISFTIPGGLITFGKCVEKFGFPDYAMQIPVMGPGLPILPASDATHIWFYAISPSRGVVYDYDIYNMWTDTTFNLTPETTIAELDFFDPQKYDELLAAPEIGELQVLHQKGHV